MEYVVFTDESYITNSRFRSLTAFSMHKSVWDKANKDITEILKSSNVTEFKWNKLKDAKYFFCAKKFVDFIFDTIKEYKIRLDILIWDTQDSRHNIFGRNDIANYERMFYHLLNNSMRRRPWSAKWDIRPDKHNEIDWNTIHDCLYAKGKQQVIQRETQLYFFISEFVSDSYYFIESFQSQCSKKEALIQIADLFSGLAIFSKENYPKFFKWKQSQKTSSDLFEKKIEIPNLSNREKVRFDLLDYFNKKCKEESFGVSLESKDCLYTFNPINPINFWHYEPQRKKDKAPVKHNQTLF